MGATSKRARKAIETDSELEDFNGMEDEQLMVDGEEDDEGEDMDDEDDGSVREEEKGDEEDEEEGEEDDSDEGDSEVEEEEEGLDEEDEVGSEEVEDDEEDDGEEQNHNGNDGEMEDLEKEYMDLRRQEQDMLKNLKRHKDEDVAKGQAVKNQKALWDKALEFRFLLQKAFSNSNRLPQEPARSAFCDSNNGVSAAYSDLVTATKQTLESLSELQEALLERNPSVFKCSDSSGKSTKNNSGGSKDADDEEWLRISQTHHRIALFRDKSIDKWQRKTQVTTGAAAMKSKLHAFNQNVSEQVASYMRDPSRRMKQMQQNRLSVGVFGTIPEDKGDVKGEVGHTGDGDPELLDDSEFYQQLLKEFFETMDPTSAEEAGYGLKKMRTKKRKAYDRRASKSRKIRYNVHEKMVNFMAPQPMNLPAMAPKLFENLFGLRTQKPNSVV